MREVYIPGLGVCTVKQRSGGYVEVTFDCHEDDLAAAGTPIEVIGCCGVCGQPGECLKDDYQCLECREGIEFDADLSTLVAQT